MDEFERLAERNDTKFAKRYRQSCIDKHADWDYKFWDLAAAEALLEDQYAWFLPTFRSLPRTVLKGDAVRAFILHAYGGVYLDMDVECLQEEDKMLAGQDLVLQCEYRTLRDINNAVLASVPGHPFWVQIMKIIMVTTQSIGDVNNPQTILHTTGPGITLQAFHHLVPEAKTAGNYVGSWKSDDGSHIRVYGVMEWYVPCEWDDHKCHQQIQEQQAAGQLPVNLVGHHHYSGSWLRETTRR
ncbi:hypothetical protein WJX72_009294 [[Myrmecia] bisecta]|uniref:Uncharacterized protein n=1 Tax=[Myrmecia] bisecta TaxID=41462 RepID=A0AAW1PFR9_9CHLO